MALLEVRDALQIGWARVSSALGAHMRGLAADPVGTTRKDPFVTANALVIALLVLYITGLVLASLIERVLPRRIQNAGAIEKSAVVNDILQEQQQQRASEPAYSPVAEHPAEPVLYAQAVQPNARRRGAAR